jgi:hypothetical protein
LVLCFSLTRTPLETFLQPRQRLFSRHFTGDEGEYLFDVRMHMAPPVVSGAVRPSHDFLARVFLPQPGLGRFGANPGGAVPRPMAEATFHMQHPHSAFSFTDFILRTDAGGSAYATGAFNLTEAWQRMGDINSDSASRVQSASSVILPPGLSTPDTSRSRLVHVHAGPRGVSTFFNLPLLGRLTSHALPRHVAGSPLAGAPASAAGAFTARHSLRDRPTLGLRFDERISSEHNLGSYSAGLHLDPQATLQQLKSGGAAAVGQSLKLGGWIAQESENFRFAAEGTIAPMQHGLRAPAVVLGGAAAGSLADGSAAAAVLAAPAGPAGLVPPSLAVRLPLLLESRFGFFYRDVRSSNSARNVTRPNFEVGFTVANQAVGEIPQTHQLQEFVASYCHHLTVRRKIHNPMEKKQNQVDTLTHPFTSCDFCAKLSLMSLFHCAAVSFHSVHQQLHRSRDGGRLPQ